MIMLGEGGVLKKVGVDADGDDFSFGISTLGFNKPRIVFFLNKKAKFVLIYFLIVSAFSLSNKRISYLKAKITSKSSQRLLTTGIKSLLGVSLLVGWFLI